MAKSRFLQIKMKGTIMKNKLLTCLLILTILIGLSGCQGKSEQYGEVKNSEESCELLTPVKCTNYTDQGMYRTDVYYPNQGTLFYCDFSTRQEIILCARPECTHTVDSCAAYFPAGDGENVPSVLVAGDQLLFYQPGPSEKDNFYFELAELNGENRHRIFEGETNQIMDGDIYTDGHYLYFCMNTTDKENAIQIRSLERVSITDGHRETLYEYPEGYVFSNLVGGAPGELILYDLELDQNQYITRYYKFNLTDKTMSEPFYTTSPGEGSFFQDGVLYCRTPNSGIYTCFDISNGDTWKLDFTSLVSEHEQGTTANTFSQFGDWARLEFTNYDENGNPVRNSYMINLKTGEFNPFSLEIQFTDSPIAVMAELEEQVCVLVDWNEGAVQVENDGVIYEVETYWPVYAMMSKDDFTKGICNYSIIQRSY